MPDGKDNAADFPVVSDGHALVRQIAQNLSKTPGFILLSGCETDDCNNLLASLESTLQRDGRAIRLQLAASSASLFEQLARHLGCHATAASAEVFAAHLEHQPVFLLCRAAETQESGALEQLRQLSNLQTTSTHLGIVLCGGKHLERALPDALKQRITATFRLASSSRSWSRHMAWLSLPIALAAGSAWFFLVYPAFFQPEAKPSISATATAPLAPSLKAGPFLAEPQTDQINDPRPRIFQSEDEAWAALRAYAASPKPSTE